MRILIFGAGGLAGAHIAQQLKQAGEEVYALLRKDCDVRDPTAVNSAIHRILPDAIINCAAYANADGAELNPELAFAVNTLGAHAIAVAAHAVNARLIHLSTNFVYSGSPDMCTPKAIEEPVKQEERERTAEGIYAHSKQLGDIYVLETHVSNIVLRTTSIYGPLGKNYVSSVAQQILAGKIPTLDPNRLVNPTSGYALARAVHALLCDVLLADLSGIVHFRCLGQTTWFEWGKTLCEMLGRPVCIEEYRPPYLAPRPNNILEIHKLVKMGYHIPIWRQALEEVAKIELAHWEAQTAKGPRA